MKRIYTALVFLLCSTVAFGQSAPSCLAPYQNALFTHATGPGDFDGGNSAYFWFGYRCYSSTSALTQPWIADIYSFNDLKHTLITCGLGGTVYETVYPLSETCANGCTVKFWFNQALPLSSGIGSPFMQVFQDRRPTFDLAAVASGKGCGAYSRSASQFLQMLGYTGFNLTIDPITNSFVAKRTGFNTSLQTVFSLGAVGPLMGFSATAGTIFGQAPFGPQTVTGMANGDFHSSFGVWSVGGGAFITGDTTSSTTGFQNATSSTGGANIGRDINSSGINYVDGVICEFGHWPAVLDGTQRGDIYNDQKAFGYGLP